MNQLQSMNPVERELARQKMLLDIEREHLGNLEREERFLKVLPFFVYSGLILIGIALALLV